MTRFSMSDNTKRKGKLLHLNVQNGDIKKLDCGIHDLLVNKTIDELGSKAVDKLVGLLKTILKNKEGIVFYDNPEDNSYDIELRRNKKIKELKIQFFHIN